MMRHIASVPNCGFARLVGLAPARRGGPGYWKHHDRDGDGIACEQWPHRQ
ncbi:excalibur calcium-binding domain-containing protein [Bradyrhizobium sp. ISRA443]